MPSRPDATQRGGTGDARAATRSQYVLDGGRRVVRGNVPTDPRGAAHRAGVGASRREAYWLDAVDREIVSVAALVGTRTSIHLQPSLIMPDLRLIPALSPGPQPDGAIGAVVDGEERGGWRPPIGTMQVWYYPVDGTVLIWEAFLASFARDRPLRPLGKDANIRRLWLRVEDSLVTHFPAATRFVTPCDDPAFETTSDRAFLGSLGYTSVASAADGKTIGMGERTGRRASSADRCSPVLLSRSIAISAFAAQIGFRRRMRGVQAPTVRRAFARVQVCLLQSLKAVHLTCLLFLVSPFYPQYCKIGKVSVGEHAGRATMVQRRSRNVQRGERGVAAAPLEPGAVVLGLTDAGDVNVRIPQRELRAVLGAVASETPTAALLRAIAVRLGEEGTEQVLRSVLAVIESATEGGRRGATTGMPPVSDDEAARAAAAVMTRSQVTRDALLHGTVGTTEAAARLHLTRQGVAERIKRGDLLAIRAGKRYRLPPWQFDVGTEDGVVVGLPQVLRALAASPLAKASWLTRPSPYLDGETPLAALAHGDVATVVAEARAVGAAGW